MSQVQDVIDMARNRSVASISRTLSVDEKTVRKYLKQDDFPPQPPRDNPGPSRLDGHMPLIDQWLQEDEKRWYKQRHTAKRIHERLTQESVRHPGETQADFGEADLREHGELVRKKYLTLSFPQSNNSFTQVLTPSAGAKG